MEDVTAISSELTAAEEEENDKQTKSGEEGEGGEGEGGEGGERDGGEGCGEEGEGEGEGERGKVEGGSVGEGKEIGSKGKGSEEKEDIAKQIAVVKYLRVSGMETWMTWNCVNADWFIHCDPYPIPFHTGWTGVH